jgi:hypothetical protein
VIGSKDRTQLTLRLKALTENIPDLLTPDCHLVTTSSKPPFHLSIRIPGAIKRVLPTKRTSE